jgi:hypothetical protein
VAYTNSVRAAFGVFPDEEDPTRKLLLPIKWNCGPWPAGRAFQFVGLSLDEQQAIIDAHGKHLSDDAQCRLRGQLHRIQWSDDAVTVSADEVLAAQNRTDKGPSKVDQGADWLRLYLRDGARPSVECMEKGNAAVGQARGLKWWRDTVLKDRLAGVSRKLGFDEGVWYFTIPGNVWPPTDSPKNPEPPKNPEEPPKKAEGFSANSSGFDPKSPKSPKSSCVCTEVPSDSSATVPLERLPATSDTHRNSSDSSDSSANSSEFSEESAAPSSTSSIGSSDSSADAQPQPSEPSTPTVSGAWEVQL